MLIFPQPEDGLSALFDMQVMWYSLAAARSYQRQKNDAMALKQWDNIRRVSRAVQGGAAALSLPQHYLQIREDQFDFHTYCLRKVTLRAYVDMLRFADRLHSHRYFFKAACLAVEVYLRMYTSPRAEGAHQEEDYTGLSQAEIKRRQKAAKRRQNKAAAAAAAQGAVKGVPEERTTCSDVALFQRRRNRKSSNGVEATRSTMIPMARS